MKYCFLGLEYLSHQCLNNILFGGGLPENHNVIEVKDEIKPIDIYCYLYSKYGKPNGLQNLARSDDSDNLIHWEWAFAWEHGLVLIQGHNFRTEVHFRGPAIIDDIDRSRFINDVKGDFKNFGKQMSERRKELEKWMQFFNPFYRISSSVDQHFHRLEELNIDLENDRISQPETKGEWDEYPSKMMEAIEKYSFATGLAYGLRSMLPVMGESFVNFILFILCKPEIKSNKRVFDSIIRQPIDLRVQLLHLHCNGFAKPIDYKSSQCSSFHSIMNHRNIILHGNVNLDEQVFGDVYFDGTVPIFDSYKDFWERSIDVSLFSVKFESIYDDKKSIDLFIDYVLGCLKPEVKDAVEFMLKSSQLGYNEKNLKSGVLFANWIPDFRAYFKAENS